MNEAKFLSINMRKALTKAYCMDLDVFLEVMHYGMKNAHTRGKWHQMMQGFAKWFCSLDSQNAERFCHWVLYSEDGE